MRRTGWVAALMLTAAAAVGGCDTGGGAGEYPEGPDTIAPAPSDTTLVPGGGEPGSQDGS